MEYTEITIGTIYKEIYILYKSGQGYISYMRPYKDIEYTPTIYRAQEFESKAEALKASAECELDYIRVVKLSTDCK